MRCLFPLLVATVGLATGHRGYRKDFDHVDTNADGLLDAYELRQQTARRDEEVLRRFFRLFDKDSSGTINFREYVLFASAK